MPKIEKITILTQEVKIIKGGSKVTFKEHLLKDQEAPEKKVEELQLKNEPYIEIRDTETGIRTLYTKQLYQHNYVKKEYKL
jgi:hypothetical protein